MLKSVDSMTIDLMSSYRVSTEAEWTFSPT